MRVMRPESVVLTPSRSLALKMMGAFACLFPWLLASAFDGSPALSWLIAWAGSWFILVLVFSGLVFDIPRDRPVLDQVLRPWFLTHVVFAGYNFLTAIFYWLELNGITFGLSDPGAYLPSDLDLAAAAQRYYVLAHAGLVIGIGLVPQVPRVVRTHVAGASMPRLLMGVALGSVVLSYVLKLDAGLSQFEVKMYGLFTVASAVGLAVTFQGKSNLRAAAIALNSVLFGLAMISGWKGGPIVMIILIAAAFYPRAPKRTLLVAVLAFCAGLVILPTTSTVIRSTAWKGEATRLKAFEESMVELRDKGGAEIMQDAWRFSVERLSEVGLFVRYLEQVPQVHPHYGAQIPLQALLSLVPRVVWPEKPDLESLVADRVEGLDVIEDREAVSAKPQYVVDGYLTAGALGVFLSLVVYGVIAQVASNLCASWLGGYLLGGVAYNGLFAILWQGSAFEFVANAVFWSFVLVFILHRIGVSAGILRR